MCSVALDKTAAALDRVRVACLARILRVGPFRAVYAQGPLRVGCSFAALAIFYLSLAFRWPAILILLGPAVFGYPHLIASYRFLANGPRILGLRPAVFFVVATNVVIGSRVAGISLGILPEWPRGSWELLAAATIAVSARPRFISALACASVTYLLWRFSWQAPLGFVAFSILFHNWVAFFTWIFRARADHRVTAALATLFFGSVNLLVFTGCADFLIPTSSFTSLSEAVQTSGSFLAPWSRDLIVWYRALVLYAFGISLHYFIWFKAIPESRGELPPSWRRTLEKARQDVGFVALPIILVAAVVGMFIWLKLPATGAWLYFEIATLHVWLELMFLVVQSADHLAERRSHLQLLSAGAQAHSAHTT
jgi:hypothetical protein